jgi:predicted HTH domain antitoxin
MCFILPDDILTSGKVTEQEARVELVCALFRLGRLSLPEGARLAGLSRDAFESSLMSRGIAPYRVTEQALNDDLAALKNMGH